MAEFPSKWSDQFSNIQNYKSEHKRSSGAKSSDVLQIPRPPTKCTLPPILQKKKPMTKRNRSCTLTVDYHNKMNETEKSATANLILSNKLSSSGKSARALSSSILPNHRNSFSFFDADVQRDRISAAAVRAFETYTSKKVKAQEQISQEEQKLEAWRRQKLIEKKAVKKNKTYIEDAAIIESVYGQMKENEKNGVSGLPNATKTHYF